MRLTVGEVKRKHHFVPVSYLAGFTDTGDKRGWLTVADLKTGDIRRSRPNATGYEKNLYRYDETGVSPDAIEDLIADEFEGPMAQVLDLLNRGSLPLEGEHYKALMRFLGLLALRVPRERRRAEADTDRIEGAMADLIFGAPERFGWLVEQMEQDGARLPEGTDLEAMRKELLEDPPRIHDQNWHMETMVEIAGEIASVLSQRAWSLWLAKIDTGGFICSDSPITMMNTDPEMSLFPMGYGRKDIVVTVPLSKRMALFGQFGGKAIQVDADRTTVAFINSRTALFAERHLYASSPDFPITLADNRVAAWPEYQAERRAVLKSGRTQL